MLPVSLSLLLSAEGHGQQPAQVRRRTAKRVSRRPIKLYISPDQFEDYILHITISMQVVSQEWLLTIENTDRQVKQLPASFTCQMNPRASMRVGLIVLFVLPVSSIYVVRSFNS